MNNSPLIIIFIIAVLIICKKLFRSPKRKGEKGERHVSWYLEKLPADSYHTYNDVIIPTKYGTTQIDHIVVSQYGVFVIETKNYSGWIFGNEKSEEWKESFRTTGSHTFRNPVKQNRGHIYALASFTHTNVDYFFSIIVFSNKATLKRVKASVPVIYMSQIVRVIKSYDSILLTEKQVENICYNIYHNQKSGEDVKDEHIKYVKETANRTKDLVAKGRCPECSGYLVERSGKYGKFLGCSNYPKCKYTHNL